MFKNIFKTLTLFALFFMLTAQQGCQTTGEKKLSSKEQVKQNMILEIKTKIEQLGGTPLTGDEAKYKGDLGKDKYIQALDKQLAELKAEEEKEEAKAKEEKEKAIAHVTKKIVDLGGKALTKDEIKYEGEFSEDKYVKALQQQLKELKEQITKDKEEAKAKEEREKAIAHVTKKIVDLGGKALTKDEIKYEGEFSEDKYVKALQQQLKELKEQITKDKEEAKKKAEKAKKEKARAAAIQAVKKEILFLGETPIPEYEFTSEDKYIAALRKQIEEIKKLKEEEELKINAEIPEWYQNLPQGSETIMYARGSAISADLDNSEQVAIENALLKLAGKLKNRINSKMDKVTKEAGVDADLTLKTEIRRISTIVVKEATVIGYKVYKTKMAPVANGKYRTFILIEFPISLAYKKHLQNLEQSTSVSTKIKKLKDTEAFKKLEEYVSQFTGA